LNTLYAYKPGDTVSLAIARGGETLDVQVTLGEAGRN
jgi:S1-C subfamily serine protease